MIDLALGTIEPGTEVGLTSAVGYCGRNGEDELRAELARWTGVSPELLTVTTGASLALLAALFIAKRPGASVLCPCPYYPAYPRLLSALDLKPIFYNVPFPLVSEVDVELIMSNANETTAAILWNFPNNPTGARDNANTYKRLLALAAPRKITVISDRVYWEVAYGSGSPWGWTGSDAAPLEIKIGSISKSLALAGERIGFAISRPDLIANIAGAQWAFAMSTSVSAQRLAVDVLRGAAEKTLLALKARLASGYQAASPLAEIPGVSVKGNDTSMFSWVELPGAAISSSQVEELFLRSGLLVTGGQAFGATVTSFRLNLAAAPALVQAGARIASSVLKHLAQLKLIGHT